MKIILLNFTTSLCVPAKIYIEMLSQAVILIRGLRVEVIAIMRNQASSYLFKELSIPSSAILIRTIQTLYFRAQPEH